MYLLCVQIYIFYILQNLCNLKEEQETINLRSGHGRSWGQIGKGMI